MHPRRHLTRAAMYRDTASTYSHEPPPMIDVFEARQSTLWYFVRISIERYQLIRLSSLSFQARVIQNKGGGGYTAGRPWSSDVAVCYMLHGHYTISFWNAVWRGMVSFWLVALSIQYTRTSSLKTFISNTSASPPLADTFGIHTGGFRSYEALKMHLIHKSSQHKARD